MIVTTKHLEKNRFTIIMVLQSNFIKEGSMTIYKLNNFGFDLLIDYYQNFDQAGQEGFISNNSRNDILELLFDCKKINKINLSSLDKESLNDLISEIESALASDGLNIEHLEACSINTKDAKETVKQYKNIINNITI
jgi:hypothetical protein